MNSFFQKNLAFNKKTKIVATFGPATSSREIILELLKKGVDVFRINFSHLKDYKQVEGQIKLIREVSKENGFNTAILADLQGPKLRIGEVKEGEILKKGDILSFTNKKVEGDKKRVYMTYEHFSNDVKVGERILLDDGKLVLECVQTNGIDEVKAKVIQGGPLKSKKGVNLPGTKVSLPALTLKDKEDAVFAISEKVDWIALSFVRHSKDIRELRELITKHSPSYEIPIISKIEKPEALENIDEIISESDGLMVARGDLGVEMPMEQVPLIQKKLVAKSKLAGIPVIIATQMMESMIENMTPTRAEVNDVANSVLDGADALMLSAETSVGKYPIEVIDQMSKIIKEVEDDPRIDVSSYKPAIEKETHFICDKISHMASKLAESSKAKAILLLEKGNRASFQVSSHRPLGTYILVYTDNKRDLTKLNLLWGVKCFFYTNSSQNDNMLKEINQLAKETKLVNQGDYVVNLFQVLQVDKEEVNTLMLSKV